MHLGNCPICNSEKRTNFVERMGLVFVQCDDCEHVYQDPVIKKEVAAKLYSEQKSAILHCINTKNIDSIKYNYGLDLIDKIELEYQNGGGFSWSFKRGYTDCVGIDVSNYASEYENEQGINYIFSTFEELDPKSIGEPYDVISMWSVLEHIYDPRNFLNNLQKILKPNGLVFILVPNLKSLATRLTREKSPCFCWKHPHMFHIKTLDLLMNKVGMKKIHCETVITEIDNIKSYLSGEFPYHGHGDPENLFEFITPEYIHNNLLGSRLISVYEKDSIK